MKRLGKVRLVPATEIIVGRAYVGCLHSDTNPEKQSYVIACEGEDDVDAVEVGAFTCRYKNGNTYPYLRNELYKFVFEYEVVSLADPTKIVGTNKVDFSDVDFEYIGSNKIGIMGNDVQAFIEFDTNTAKLITNTISFSLEEVFKILESMKSGNTDDMSRNEHVHNNFHNFLIDSKIKELKHQYNG